METVAESLQATEKEMASHMSVLSERIDTTNQGITISAEHTRRLQPGKTDSSQ